MQLVLKLFSPRGLVQIFLLPQTSEAGKLFIKLFANIFLKVISQSSDNKKEFVNEVTIDDLSNNEEIHK